MLVLNRKRHERVIITTALGEQIIVSIEDVRFHRDYVKLGFEANPSITILREELTTIPEIEPGEPGRKFGKQ